MVGLRLLALAFGGRRAWVPVPGPFQTVQRAKFWGGILALQAFWPDHLGIDNLNVVRPSGCRAITHSETERYFSGRTTTRTSERSARCRARRSEASSGLTAECPQVTILTNPLPNCPTRDTTLAERDKHLLTELRLASVMHSCDRGLSVRHGLERKSRRSHERSPVLVRVVPLPLSLVPC